MKLTETAQKLIAEFREAAVDFSREENLDTLHKFTEKRQRLEAYIRNLEAIVLEKDS